MQLLHLKILTQFRGLPAGSEFTFSNEELSKNRLEPICLVGLNGSGKSNLLELIAEIFYYLDIYAHQTENSLENFKNGFGFEITYALDINYQLASRSKLRNLGQLPWEGLRNSKFKL
ncbi:MAG: hypothetical protein IPN20_12560 [Haliscomenobacter sp.]|nr:hypothetical protein [Haliscomenobacter sp.]